MADTPPSGNETSALTIYSLGYVAADSTEDSPFIEVYPIEIISDASGVVSDSTPESNTTKDMNGNTLNIQANKSYTITAKWSNMMQPNRITPPNVMKGETVMLWKFGNDRWFWTNFYNELDLRTKEKAIWAFSNKSGITDRSQLTNAYFMAFDTINKFFQIHTDDGDGELTTYDVKIDSKNGVFNVLDGKNNEIRLDSANNILTINTNNQMAVNTKNDVTVNTKTVHINLNTLSIKNSTTELMQTLSDLLQAIIEEQHVGNLGIPTTLTPSSVSKFNGIKSRIDSFIGG